MALPTFSVGNDIRLVFIGAYGRIDLSHIVSFEAKPLTKKVTSMPLNRSPIMRFLPGGWSFTFEIDRANVNADALQALKDLSFWNGIAVPSETLYAYISEPDGSTSTWQYQDVTTELQDAGKWHQEAVVKQKVEGFASQRIYVQ